MLERCDVVLIAVNAEVFQTETGQRVFKNITTMKLELKHLAPYFPYELKCKLTDLGKETIAELSGCYSDNSYAFFDTVESEHGFSDIKPILRPLSDLSNYAQDDFTINEHLINSVMTEKQYGQEYGVFCFYKGDITIELDGDSDLRYDQRKSIHWDCIQKINELLFQGHFDVFGLIPAGLAIDINTLKQEQ